MAHYAFLDSEGTVTEVIVGRDEGELGWTGAQWEAYYAEFRGLPASQCRRTSYNTVNGQHPAGRPYRGNYAGIGYQYLPDIDAFVPPRPSDDAVLDETTFSWTEN